MKTAVIVAVAIFAVIAVSLSSAASRSVPVRYFYTGWMAASATPGNYFVVGDAVTLDFRSLQPLTTYTLCVRKVGGNYTRCITRKATLARVSIAPWPFNASATIPFGSYVATWRVGDSTVAKWSFYWGQGD